VSCTNYNCPGQVVIGGEEPAVLLAEELLRDCGARRLIVLNTSGPFHTALMSEPARLLALRLQGLEFQPQSLPVVFNTTASLAADSEVKELLVRQIAAPVLFAQSLMTLRQLGVTRIIEIGPGHVLAGLVKKTTPEIEVFSIEDAQSLKEVLGQ
jgi:[acyl-carrier-protein] S-malonyltransferase